MKRPIALSLLLFVLFGCSQQPSLVGTWNSASRGATTVWHFHPDGKMETEVNYEGTMIHTTGTYSLSGGMLACTNETSEGVGREPNLSTYKAKLLEPSSLNAHFQSPTVLAIELPGQPDPFLLHRMSPVP